MNGTISDCRTCTTMNSTTAKTTACPIAGMEPYTAVSLCVHRLGDKCAIIPMAMSAATCQ